MSPAIFANRRIFYKFFNFFQNQRIFLRISSIDLFLEINSLHNGKFLLKILFKNFKKLVDSIFKTTVSRLYYGIIIIYFEKIEKFVTILKIDGFCKLTVTNIKS
jgi:hypothetical protein